MSKPKFNKGDQVLIWRRCQVTWYSAKDSLLGKTCVIIGKTRNKDNKLLYVVKCEGTSHYVTGSCLRLV